MRQPESAGRQGIAVRFGGLYGQVLQSRRLGQDWRPRVTDASIWRDVHWKYRV